MRSKVRSGPIRRGVLVVMAAALALAACATAEEDPDTTAGETTEEATEETPEAPADEDEESADDRADWPSGLNIGTSSQGTASYTVGAGLADVLSGELDIAGTPMATGFGTNISLVAEGEAQMGMVWPFSTLQAIQGEGDFEGVDLPLENIRLMNAGTFFPGGIVVLADSEYETIEDLEGARILAERPISPDTTMMVRALLEGAGLMEGDYERLSYEGPSDAIPALTQGQADAFGFLTDPAAAWAVEADELHGIRILGLTEEQQQAILPEFPWLSPGVIPEGSLSGQDQDAYTVQDQTLMIVHADLPDSLVYALLETFVDQRENLGGYHPTGSEWFDPDSMLNVSGVVPFHDGAIRYYEDQGMWTSDHQADHEEALTRLLEGR